MAHANLIIDSDIRFEINPYTRTLVDLTPARKTIVQYDHNSERYTFALPRVIEGHDMSLCDLVEVHFINIDAETDVEYDGKCVITDLKVSEIDDQVVTLSWLVSKISTQHVGPLHFSLRFVCLDRDGEVTYEWNTRKFTAIRIVSGMGNRDAMDMADAQVRDTIERLGLVYPTVPYVKTINNNPPDENGNIDIPTITEEDALDLLIEMDMLPTLTDADGKILIDDSGAILLG